MRLAASALASNLMQPDFGSIEIIEHAFVHRIHESADTGSVGRTLLPNLNPHVCACLAEACVVVDLVNALMQALASFVTSSFTLIVDSPAEIPKGPFQMVIVF